MKKFDPYNVDERKMSCGEAYKRLLALYKALQESRAEEYRKGAKNGR